MDGRLFTPLRYPLDQLLMMHRLAGEGGAIVHCAVVGVGDRAVICPGVSGAGKTTLSRQLAGSSDFEVLSDDRAVIRRSGEGYRAWGTPWPGEGGLAVNRSLPLASIGFIAHGETPSIERLSPSQAIHRVVRVASVPWFDREAGPGTFDGLAELCSRVPAFELRVPATSSAQHAVRALAEAGTLSTAR
jgi:serine kinase of HPr protein (carbohydrate metabolism regulator)